jgi:cytosine/adenosine deaminase-related metal-dependent hydrolase
MSRRKFLLSSGAGVVAGAMAAQSPSGPIFAADRGVEEIDPSNLHGRSILLKGGVVLSLDPDIGDFDSADVLIEGSKIVSIQPNLTVEAEVIDASNMIIMPGFVDTHRHMWQGQLRNILPNGVLSVYLREILGTARSLYRPEDAYAGDLLTGLGAVNAGVTTVLDWSHIANSPEHTDAAIFGLRDSGIRAVYAYGSGTAGPSNLFPQDIRRLRSQFFSSDDQLLTLAMAADINPADWAIAREVGAPITVHVNGTNELLPAARAMGPDLTYIHCPNLSEAEWQLIASTGGNVSISAPIEMEMGHGVPAIQQALDHGIRPSLSVDVETEMPSELFTQMRTVFILQRMLLLARERAGETNLPGLLRVRDVVEFATIEGARDNRLDHRTGSLTPGKEADIIMLGMNAINVMPVNDAYGAIVLGMDTSNVETVLIGGKIKKWKGKLVGVDLDRVSRLAHRSRDRIVSNAGWPRTLFREFPPAV